METGVYLWAAESLGSAATTYLNDFMSPIVMLVVAASNAIQSNYPLKPSRGLPFFLPNHGGAASAVAWGSQSTHAPPWGNRTVVGTNPSDVPNTGITRSYDFTVSRGIIAPDGVNKSAILVNNQYPGPLIEANWGDYIEVTVHNEICGPEEGTALHWHGMTQKGTPFYDGTPSISQCPVAPGSSFKYKFQASLYGTSWWHSHFSAQYTDGLYGPMVVYGPTHEDYDFDLGPLLIHDYYHADYTTLIGNVMGNNTLTALFAPSDNTLMHGPTYVCSLTANDKCEEDPGLTKFNFTSGKSHRLRLINPSSSGSPILFSIDNHTLEIIANDMTPIVPYTTNVVSIGAGQRTDVIIKGTGNPGDVFWMRARQPDLCSLVLQPFALAAIYYEDANTQQIPLSVSQSDFLIPRLQNCDNDPLNLTTPAYKMTPTMEPDTTVVINMALVINATNHTLYEINNQAFRGDFNSPILRQAADGTTSYPMNPEWNVIDFGTNQTIRLIINNNMPYGHPMHLHGQQFSVLDVGTGSWDNVTIINPENPQRRDTQLVPANGYMIAQIDTLNPGIWPLHCHIAWHLSSGMLVNLMFKPEELHKMEVDQIMRQTCDAWDAYTKRNVVDQIDSGL